MSLNDARLRSTLMSERIQQRTDQDIRDLIDSFNIDLEFRPLDEMMISERAWESVVESGVAPKLVFAHPSLLQRFPQASQYYRGVALLPQKRVREIAVSVSSWEDGSRKSPITND